MFCRLFFRVRTGNRGSLHAGLKNSPAILSNFKGPGYLDVVRRPHWMVKPTLMECDTPPLDPVILSV